MIELEYKGYTIYKSANNVLWRIRLDGKGGSVPDVLTGQYTTYGTAKAAIDLYLDQKAGDKDGGNTTRSK